jgi:hypothetical protein
MHVNKATVIAKLMDFYHTKDENTVPNQRVRSKWTNENKFGFLRGIVEYGNAADIEELSIIVDSCDRNAVDRFIARSFAFYIDPFKRLHAGSCRTRPASSRPSSRNGPVDGEMTHNDLKKAVVERDGQCLFCWTSRSCEGAHIITQKIQECEYDESSILARADLKSKHAVQNGLLLCSVCHCQFDLLKIYVHEVTVGGKLAVRFINATNDDNDVELRRARKTTKWSRMGNAEFIADQRSIEEDGEMLLYFINDDPTLQPNRKALQFHKTACLIWRMAGGAEPDEEYCSDCDSDDGANIPSIGKVQEWQLSNELAADI